MENTKSKLLFESVTCSRCGGGGHYSYCQMYGTICFKCHGRGSVLTKRGHVAQEFLTASLSARAADVKPGQRFLMDGIPGFTRSQWITVESVEPDALNPGMIKVAGVGGCYIASPDTRLRIFHNAEEKAPKIAAALAFQATLTKTGTVRKVRS